MEWTVWSWNPCRLRENFSKIFSRKVNANTLRYAVWQAKHHHVTSTELFICRSYQSIRLLHVTGCDSEQVEGVILSLTDVYTYAYRMQQVLQRDG